MHILENEKLSLSMTAEGTLASLKNKLTGHEYITHPGGDTWRLFLYEGKPGEPKVGTMPYCWEIPVYARDQKPRITKEGDSLRVEYEGLKCAETGASMKYATRAGLTGRALAIKFAYRVTLKGDETIWEAEIENNEDLGVGEIWFPMISGVTWLTPDKSDCLLMPHFFGEKINKPLTTMTHKRIGMIGDISPSITHEMYPYRLLYPGYASMQWYALCNENEGLYMGSHDRSIQTTCLNVDKDVSGGQENLQLTFGKYPCLEKGGKWKSAPFVVSAYAGNWHVAARKYKAWASTWMKKQKPPQWTREMNGWQWICLKYQSGVIQFTYDEIPRLYRDATLGGLNATWLVGWPHAGNDREYPDYPYNIDPRLGTEDELKQGLAYIRQQGGHVWLYNNGRMLDPETKWYKDIGHRISMKTIWGGEYIENWAYWFHGSMMDISNQYKLLVGCPATREWSDLMLDYAKRSKELGTNVVFYDYWLLLRPYLCFDKSHDHATPAMAYGPGMVAILERVRREMTKIDPDFAMITEGINDAAGQYVDVAQGGPLAKGPGQDIYAPGNPDPRHEAFPELIRFTFPEFILSNRELGAEDYANLNWAFVYGFLFDIEINFNRGTLKDAPQLAAQCRRLCEIRNKYRDVLLEGTFMDDEGFTLNNPRLVAKSYQQGKKQAVLVWNPEADAQPVVLTVPGYTLTKAVGMQGESASIPASLPGNEVMALIYES